MRYLALALLILVTMSSVLQARPVVMLTGYWAPTSEMLARFSTDPDLNPDGWIGENWEGFGYDVHAFFPAFNKQTREFEVDYQATWEDFWARTDEYHPEIIISFGAMTEGDDWVIEDDAFNWDSWIADDSYPYYPTPNPPDSTMAAGAARFSTLPMEAIRDAVTDATTFRVSINEAGNPGFFLCNYIAYLGMWYQAIHSRPGDEFHCDAAGFVHVDAEVRLDQAVLAAEATLRTTLLAFADITAADGPVVAAVPQLSIYPNPFNPQTTVSFTMPEAGHARLQVVDLRGRLVASLLDGDLAAGRHAVVWDGRNDGGRGMPSGVYFARLSVGSDESLTRMSLVR